MIKINRCIFIINIIRRDLMLHLLQGITTVCLIMIFIKASIIFFAMIVTTFVVTFTINNI